ncbi:MAG: DUF58 domain-containing protein [Flavobacteriales bacterium]|nr:DUF58 domain-containing protein [Flavobacteriales bacterium]MCB9448759.1 DUF58 domain-containing protein [Flavobacteriales bacterium]
MAKTEQIDLLSLPHFGNLELIARQVVEGFVTGLHKSPFHGFSVEFAEHRIYNKGESTRDLDWKLFGRTDKLFVKRYEEETNLRCQIVIDNSSSMYFPFDEFNESGQPINKVVFSLYAAASLINLLKKQRDAIGLSLFAEQLELHTEAKSNNLHIKRLYHELEKLLIPIPGDAHKVTAAAGVLHEIAEKLHKRSLVIIFSDMMESAGDPEVVFSALQHLRHNKHEVILFHVTDREKEIEFNYANRPYRFVDVESGRELKLHPREVRDAYKKQIAHFLKELKIRCGQYRIEFVDADIRQGFRQVLLPYLIKRGKLY